MPVTHVALSKDDLADPALTVLNEIIRMHTDELNRLGGFNGPVRLNSHLNMDGNRVMNVGSPVASADAISQASADPIYGPDAVRANMEATGTKMLQTVRRLNDRTQREQSSTFLNQVMSTPPGSNASNVTVVDNGGNPGTITATCTADFQRMADDAIFPYAQRQDTITKQGTGTSVAYYYFDYPSQTLVLSQVFASDSSTNRLTVNKDGRFFVGLVNIPAPNVAGGTGSGGGDPGRVGCCEVGTPLDFPPDSKIQIEVEPCAQWVEIETVLGRKLSVAQGTLVSVFHRAEHLPEKAMIEVKNGHWEMLKSITLVRRESVKMKAYVTPGGCYFGNSIRLHNWKP